MYSVSLEQRPRSFLFLQTQLAPVSARMWACHLAGVSTTSLEGRGWERGSSTYVDGDDVHHGGECSQSGAELPREGGIVDFVLLRQISVPDQTNHLPLTSRRGAGGSGKAHMTAAPKAENASKGGLVHALVDAGDDALDAVKGARNGAIDAFFELHDWFDGSSGRFKAAWGGVAREAGGNGGRRQVRNSSCAGESGRRWKGVSCGWRVRRLEGQRQSKFSAVADRIKLVQKLLPAATCGARLLGRVGTEGAEGKRKEGRRDEGGACGDETKTKSSPGKAVLSMPGGRWQRFVRSTSALSFLGRFPCTAPDALKRDGQRNKCLSAGLAGDDGIDNQLPEADGIRLWQALRRALRRMQWPAR